MFPSNKRSEKAEMKISGQVMSDKTFRVEFGFDIYVKHRGIGVVFGHTSKIIYHTIVA